VIAAVFTEAGIGEGFMTWKNLKRATRWTKNIYGLECGIETERQSYTWLRKKPTGAMRGAYMKELELRIGAREGAERGVECIAKCARGKGTKTTRRSCLYLQKTGNLMEDGRWEHVVIVTFLVALEIFCQLHCSSSCSKWRVGCSSGI
jgi:hypothetical protein